MTPDDFTLSQWYAIGRIEDFDGPEPAVIRLLSRNLTVRRADSGLLASGPEGNLLPTQTRFGHVWTTLSDTPRDLYNMPEFEEPGRRLITGGGGIGAVLGPARGRKLPRHGAFPVRPHRNSWR